MEKTSWLNKRRTPPTGNEFTQTSAAMDATSAIPPRSIASAISAPVVTGITITLLCGTIAIGILVPRYVRDATLSSLTRAGVETARHFAIARRHGLDLTSAQGAFAKSDGGVEIPPSAFRLFDASLDPADAGRPADAFEREAWRRLQGDPREVVSQVEAQSGRRMVRIAFADPLPTGSPGMVEVSRDIEADLVRAEEVAWTILFVRSIVAVLVIAALLWLNLHSRRRAREHAALHARVTLMAYTDGMTGLLNRSRFMELAETLSRNARDFHVQLIDVDHFKEINDEHGHGAGDAVILEVARRLGECARPNDLVARLGGDEFILAGPLAGGAEVAQERGRAIVSALSRPFHFGAQLVPLSASVGCAMSSHERHSLDQIILDADEALYHAKQSGRNRLELFTDRLQLQRFERRHVEKLLRKALLRGGFECHYQPVVDAARGRIKAFEVLLRLPDDRGGYIPPSQFIPLAEELKLICAIGEHVLAEALALASTWPESIAINVNLSPRQFSPRDNDGRPIVEILRDVLASTGINPGRVTLEVTESVLLHDTEHVLEQLDAIKAMGLRTALDDFGSGYSSLSYLWKFDFDTLKIDQSFARGLEDHTGNMVEVIRSITSMARSLELEIVAEGIETESEAQFFRDQGCDGLQGYLFGRPMPDSAVASFIAAQAARPVSPAQLRQVV